MHHIFGLIIKRAAPSSDDPLVSLLKLFRMTQPENGQADAPGDERCMLDRKEMMSVGR